MIQQYKRYYASGQETRYPQNLAVTIIKEKIMNKQEIEKYKNYFREDWNKDLIDYIFENFYVNYGFRKLKQFNCLWKKCGGMWFLKHPDSCIYDHKFTLIPKKTSIDQKTYLLTQPYNYGNPKRLNFEKLCKDNNLEIKYTEINIHHPACIGIWISKKD